MALYAKTGVGIDILEEKILELFDAGNLDVDDGFFITNERHRELVNKARLGLENALNSVNLGMPLDMLSIDIQNAIQKLGEITGEEVSEDVIKGIFAKFCLGK